MNKDGVERLSHLGRSLELADAKGALDDVKVSFNGLERHGHRLAGALGRGGSGESSTKDNSRGGVAHLAA